jgi:nudix-type nucleoside diphosphatase (YffH/AdpP family)
MDSNAKDSMPSTPWFGMQRNDVMGVTTLLEGWSKVIRIVYRQIRRDGSRQIQDRDLLDRGDGVTVLLYNKSKGTVLLLKQPRIVATMRGHSSGEMIEACNGLIEDEEPMECARREVLQETGHQPIDMVPVAQIYACPGGSLEIVHLFFAQYSHSTQVGSGGGLHEEGEDIELLEVPMEQAMRWIDHGVIQDGRTIITLQYACLRNIMT